MLTSYQKSNSEFENMDYGTRFRKGNSICTELWKHACKNTGDAAEWANCMDKLERTATRLHHLVLEMQANGYGACPYSPEPKCTAATDVVCWACPSIIAHWRTESKRLL